MVQAQPTVLLFDIDGTLLLTGGCGRRAFERAFQAVIGRHDFLAQFTFGGMTDRGIARLGLKTAGEAIDEARIDALVDAYVAALEDELSRGENFRLTPNAGELVRSTRSHKHVAVGLGTGNIKRGAAAKLKRGALWELFDFGGFGCDHEDRTQLLRAGALRGAAQLGAQLEACRVVVIGDTVRDVDAALGISAECIGVETGGVAGSVLLAAGAKRVFSDLSADGVLASLLAP